MTTEAPRGDAWFDPWRCCTGAAGAGFSTALLTTISASEQRQRARKPADAAIWCATVNALGACLAHMVLRGVGTGALATPTGNARGTSPIPARYLPRHVTSTALRNACDRLAELDLAEKARGDHAERLSTTLRPTARFVALERPAT